jgi:DNA-binding CsgD family transcriptional regulator
VPKTDRSLKTWSDHVAGLIASANDLELLPERLLAAMDALSPGERCVAALLGGKLGTIGVWTSFSASDEPALTKAVRSGKAFQIDPYYGALTEGLSGCLPLWEIAPKGFADSSHYQELYVAEGVLDEIIHLIPVDGGRIVFIDAVRSDRMFTKKEIKLHHEAHAAIAACSVHIARLMGDVDDGAGATPVTHVDGALEEFGAEVLTPREMDVIHLVLRGHSTESAAHQLGISWNTVKRHRLTAYTKLRVGSQGELFYEFLRTIGLRPDA